MKFSKNVKLKGPMIPLNRDHKLQIKLLKLNGIEAGPTMRKFLLLLSALITTVGLNAHATTPDTFTLERLLGFIQSENITSTDQLIEKAPDSWLEYHILLFSSRSAQPATIERPRVILQNSDSSLQIGISGGAIDHPAAHKIEVIEFEKATKTYNFYQISLPVKTSDTLTVQKNPTSCFGCHDSGGQLRPNWEIYNKWPGVFTDPERIGNEKTVIQRLQNTTDLTYKKLLTVPKRQPKSGVFGGLFSSSAGQTLSRYYEENSAHLNFNLDLQKMSQLIDWIEASDFSKNITAFLLATAVPSETTPWRFLEMDQLEYQEKYEATFFAIKENSFDYELRVSKASITELGVTARPYGSEREPSKAQVHLVMAFEKLGIDLKTMSHTFFGQTYREYGNNGFAEFSEIFIQQLLIYNATKLNVSLKRSRVYPKVLKDSTIASSTTIAPNFSVLERKLLNFGADFSLKSIRNEAAMVLKKLREDSKPAACSSLF